ncbi:ArsR/SmtB family transcription factor [Culicoidibacter larvae]|uniref:Winged helix-turn-helix transcriptional regulator n=1 Tax=Culicoidibacter larvae TaxID=2579976 RepID=A0A5R8QGW9_9FIRM|nr:metalloregulator ArsR/SmtB family transcription factor [Culicoidibacter larvae]TLG77222.1 winged helix-turn-helix transcriptional regulator [Culicoidibacter larvae]
MGSYIDIEEVCKLLADSTRLEIINMLSDKEVCICNLVDRFNISQPAISKHIKKLKDAGMLLERKQAQWNYYMLNKDYKYFDLVQYIIKMCPKDGLIQV